MKSLTNAFERLGEQRRSHPRPARWRARDLQQQLMRGTAAKRQQTGRRQIRKVDEDARAQRKRAQVATGLVLDHAANLKRLRADQKVVAHAQIELRQQFGANEDAMAAQQVVRVRLFPQRHRSVERKCRLHRAELDHPRRRDGPSVAPSSTSSTASDRA